MNKMKVVKIIIVILFLGLVSYILYKLLKPKQGTKQGLKPLNIIQLPPYMKPDDNIHASLRRYFIALYPQNKLALINKGISIENMSKIDLLNLYQSLICFYNPGIVNNNSKSISDTIPATFGNNLDMSLTKKTIDNLTEELNLIFGGKLRQYSPNWSLDSKTKEQMIEKNLNNVMPNIGCETKMTPPGVSVLFDNTIDKCLRFQIKNTYPVCNGGGYEKGFPYRWSGMLPIVSPVWVGSYARMGGFPDFSLFEGYTAPGESGIPIECQGGNLGRLPIELTENLLYGSTPIKLPVTFSDGEKPSITNNFWWDFGFNPTKNTILPSAALNTSSDANAPRMVCLPYSECDDQGNCEAKLNKNKYINSSWYCNDTNFVPTDYTDPISGTVSPDMGGCCNVNTCQTTGGNNYPCDNVTISPEDKRASTFYDVFSNVNNYGYPEIGDSIKEVMKYKGYSRKSGDMFENYQNLSKPTLQQFIWGTFKNINKDLKVNEFSDAETYVKNNQKWYWPLKGYGIWTYMGTTHGVATKYGFLLEGSESDPRPITRKMFMLNGKSVPIGGGMTIDYICTSPNTDKFTYFNLDTPFQIGDNTNTFSIPSPQSVQDIKDNPGKYDTSNILTSELTNWLRKRTFYGGTNGQTYDPTYSAVFIYIKQINDLYGAVGTNSKFVGYPIGKKLSFKQCKEMVTLFHISGMVPKNGLKGCNQENLIHMSNEVWMKQFNNGKINPNYNETLSSNFICVSEWLYNGQMYGCMYGWSSQLSPSFTNNQIKWTNGSASWPVGCYLINDQVNGQCMNFLTDIAGDREYNTVQFTCSLQGGIAIDCFVTTPYSPEVLKLNCNRFLDENGNSVCYYPNKQTLPAAGTYFSKFYDESESLSKSIPIIRIQSNTGKYTTKGIGKFSDQEGDINYTRTNPNNIKFPYTICASSYLIDPFEDIENYIYNGFVDARKLNENSSKNMGAGIKLFDNRIMKLSTYSAIQNISSYAQEDKNTNIGTWQIVQNLPTYALGWKAFTDNKYKTSIKSAVNFFDALSNILDNTKKVFFFGGNELNLLPTTEDFQQYCCAMPPSGPNTDKIDEETGYLFEKSDQGLTNPNGGRACTEQNFCNNRICSETESVSKSLLLLNSIINALKRGVEIIGYYHCDYGGDQTYTSWADLHYLGDQNINPKQDLGTLGTINYIRDQTKLVPVGNTGKMAWEFWKVIPSSNTFKSMGWLSTVYPHSKMYVSDPNEKYNAVYIGSQNFTYSIGKETGIAIYNCPAVAKSAARNIGYIRYLLWYSQGYPTWTDIWNNTTFSNMDTITWDLISPYFYVNVLSPTSQKKVVKLYGNNFSNGLQNINGDYILDHNKQIITNFPDRTFDLNDFLSQIPDINNTNKFLTDFFNRDMSDSSVFNKNNWVDILDGSSINPDMANSILNACNGNGYIKTSDGTIKPNPEGLNVWWNLPNIDDIDSYVNIEKNMQNNGWGDNNIICKKGPEWPGDKSTISRPIESCTDNPIRVYLTKQQDNTLWSNASPNPVYYPEYSNVVISSTVIGCIQGRQSLTESIDHFLGFTSKYMYIQSMYLFDYFVMSDETILSDKYFHYGVINALNKGADIKFNVTNFGRLCRTCSIPNNSLLNSPAINNNYIQQLWIALYGNACGQNNQSSGHINVRSFNFAAQPLPGTKCRLPSECTKLPCDYTPTETEEQTLYFDSPNCANISPKEIKSAPTTPGYGLDHGRLAVSENMVFLSNNDYSLGQNIQRLGCGILISNPSIIQEFTNLAIRDYNSKYSFNIVNTNEYPGITNSTISEIQQLNDKNPGPGWFCWDKNNYNRPCSWNSDVNPKWSTDYVKKYGDLPCSPPTSKNKFWPGTGATCFSHPSCKQVEQKLSDIKYNFPDSNYSLPMFSNNSSHNSSNNKGLLKSPLRRHN